MTAATAEQGPPDAAQRRRDPMTLGGVRWLRNALDQKRVSSASTTGPRLSKHRREISRHYSMTRTEKQILAGEAAIRCLFEELLTCPGMNRSIIV